MLLRKPAALDGVPILFGRISCGAGRFLITNEETSEASSAESSLTVSISINWFVVLFISSMLFLPRYFGLCLSPKRFIICYRPNRSEIAGHFDQQQQGPVISSRWRSTLLLPTPVFPLLYIVVGAYKLSWEKVSPSNTWWASNVIYIFLIINYLQCTCIQ